MRAGRVVYSEIMKLFLSTTFSGKVNYDTLEVEPEFRRQIEQILATLRAAGHEVFAAVEDEGWRISDADPVEAVRYDIRRIEAADALVALLHDAPSAGVQWEIGYADALGKKVYVLSEEGTNIGYWNSALEKLGRVTRLPYSEKNIQELAGAARSLAT